MVFCRDLSHRGDVFDVLMDHIFLNDCILPEGLLQRKVAEEASASTSPPQLGGTFAELRPLAAANIGRLIAGEPAGMVHELLPFFGQEGNERHLVKFYLFQTLKQVCLYRNFFEKKKLKQKIFC